MDDILYPYLTNLPLGGWRFFETLGSTNDAAMDWVKNGAPDMALVVADTQLEGRGRFRRHWVTVPGAALAMSLVLHPSPREMEFFYRFSGLGALAIASALDHFHLAAQIKWPNDVLLQRQKTAGILVENSWMGGRIEALVIGIGVNVSLPSVPAPDQVMFPATCLETALGSPIDRWSVLQAILASLVDWRSRLSSAEFIAVWEERLAFKGEWVRISAAGGADRVGRVAGISPSGSLRLIGEGGAEFSVDTGDVSLRTVDNA